MAFTSFNSSQGHKQISNEIIAELQALAARHGLRFSSEGGALGTNDLMIKLRVRAADRSAVDADAKRAFGFEARYMGLEPDDYGAIFSTINGRYKLVGIKTSRPKYPFLGECLATGKTYKLPRSIVPNVIAARQNKPTAAPQVVTQNTSQPAAAANQDADDRYADLAAF